MIYVDTSVIIAALTPEAATPAVHAWLAAQPAGSLYVSGWTTTEVSGALAIKITTNQFTLHQRADVLSRWHKLRMESFHLADVPAAAFDLAARFVDRQDLALRAGDALHLAVASLGGYSLATLDKLLARAAPEVGVHPVSSVLI